ncbi:glycosyl hydrolase family 28-related protein [Jannaschia sp. 2305UL9-9]|uniref:glycosyl hydrolase family 28-related protein n=1 Tax=Jannaschia sp. 2305UL9-9 TaxID=3121638 RepID=UPI0035291BE0
MNKAITEGLEFNPPMFEDGLTQWSRQDGLPGSDTYAASGNATLVAADADFASCLEMLKTESTQKLRSMQRTEILAGCYLRVTARVKAISGNLPSVRIGAFPIASNGNGIGGLTQAGPATQLAAYGRVETITAIIGTGSRGGVDLAWDNQVANAHVGLDLTGPNGGVVRIDDITIEDVTGAYLRTMMDWVDVRDYGAVGDGVADDTAAFLAADAAANGREVLVSKGTYKLTDHVTFNERVRFEGTVTIPASRRLSLVQNFDLGTYIDAFGDEEEGFRNAIQALFNFTDHDTLDMQGRRVLLTEPLDVQGAVYDKDTYANQRKIRNGQIDVAGGAPFEDTVVTANAAYDSGNPTRLSSIANVANIPVGALVTANAGVGREVYVTSVNVANSYVELSNPLHGAPASQTYTFRRFKYMMDFSGFANLQRFTLQDIEFLMAGQCSGVLLPLNGLIFHMKDCFFTGPKDRAITSHGTGCQGMLIDRCQFLSNENVLRVQDRTTIAFNVNKNDTKIRNNRANKFRHFAVMGGSGHIVTGNHFFQGDNETLGQRTAGIVFAEAQAKTIFGSNYVDNCYIEWTNEYDPNPDFASELSFGGLQILGNIIFSSGVPSSYAPIHVKPYGSGHYINGVTITGNTFKTIKGQALARVDMVDTTFADLDHSRYNDISVHSNTFYAVSNQFQNPITVPAVKGTAAANWDIDLTSYLPFGGEARVVQSVMPEGRITNASNVTVWDLPYATPGINGDRQSIRLSWPQASKGKVFVTARCDAPT